MELERACIIVEPSLSLSPKSATLIDHVLPDIRVPGAEQGLGVALRLKQPRDQNHLHCPDFDGFRLVLDEVLEVTAEAVRTVGASLTAALLGSDRQPNVAVAFALADAEDRGESDDLGGTGRGLRGLEIRRANGSTTLPPIYHIY